MNRARLVGRFSLVVAALMSLLILRTLRPAGTGAAIFLGVWLLLPYAVLAFVLEARSSANDLANAVTTLLVTAGGVLFLIIVIFVNPDPQGGIAVLFTPIYQGIAASVLLPLTRWLIARNARGKGER